MKNFEIGGIQISAISACVPKQIEYTSAYEGFSSAEASSFEKHVGVISKRNTNGKLTAVDLCLAATEKLVKDIAWNKNDIGLLIFVSQSPDYILPNTALLLQHKLGLNSGCICFDLRVGCTGWVTGLSVAASMTKSFFIKKALLLAGETNIIAVIRDKATYPLMGDAGTATALELNENASPMFFNFSSDGEQHQAIIASKSGARSDVTKEQIVDFLDELKITYTKATFYRTVSANLSDIKNLNDFDLLVFFTPAGIKSLKQNFPNFKQGNTRIAAFGHVAAQTVKDLGYRLDIFAPNPQNASMTGAIDAYLKESNKR